MSSNLQFKLVSLLVISTYIYSFSAAQSTGSLVGDWQMDEGGGLILSDNSGNGNDALLQNENDVFWDAGKDGLAVFLPGYKNRFAIAPNDESLNITDELTIAAWISPAEVRNSPVISKIGQDGYELAIIKEGRVEFSFNSDTYGSTFSIRSNASYPSDGNTWMHIAATYDGAASKIYINGHLDVTVPFSNPVPINSNTADLYIGSRLGSRRWKGGLDEVKLYNDALTAAEIASLAFITQPSEPTLTTVAIASNNSNASLAKAGDIVTLSFTASEPINPPGVTIATQGVTATAGGGNSYTAAYTMTGSDASGVVPFTINFSNTAGTAETPVSTTTNGSSVIFDKTLPVVTSINPQVPSTTTTNATSVTYRATFSEAVNGVDASDFSLTVTSGAVSGTVSAARAVSSSVYDVTVTSISGNGVLRLDLKSNGSGITDAAGNAEVSGFTSGQTFTVQHDIPTLTSVSILSDNPMPTLAKPGNVITLSFTASDQISTPTVTIATHEVPITAHSDNSYIATYTMVTSDVPGTIPFSIYYSVPGTPFGNEVVATTDGTVIAFDNAKPAVVSINRQSPFSNPTNLPSVIFRVTFSEAVSGVDVTDFSIATTGTVSASILSVAVASVCGCISTYDVSISSISGSGTLQLDLNTSGTGITDPSGNFLDNGFSGGEGYTISDPAPTLSSVTITSNNSTASLAKAGDMITLRFSASEVITTPAVTLATHPVTTEATGNDYVSEYTMTEVDDAGPVPFTIDFTKAGGQPAEHVTSTTDGSSVIFDNVAPTISGISRQNPASNPTDATSVTFRASFSEAATGVDTHDFSLLTLDGSATGTIATVTPVNVSIFDITVSAIAGNGTIRLDLINSGTGITDAAGNAITGGFTAGQTYTIAQSSNQTGFSSVIQLTPFEISKETKDKPQAKAWKYADQWWCVLSEMDGTKIFRLDGTTWISVLTLTDKNGKADCYVEGNLVHILCSKDISLFYTVEYDPVLNGYKLWHLRPENSTSTISLPSGNETATVVVDGEGRMWVATDATSQIYVWWSDAPYTTWSAPIIVATGLKDDDICSLAALPSQHKIGIFWSNQNTERFGFRTHADGSDPNIWSADEIPASQSAMDVGKGMADDHMSIQVASDGTLYCAAKTGFDEDTYPRLILLIRRPDGNWDNAHTVTEYPEGTQPILLLNEIMGQLKVVYTTATNGGDIVYRESPVSNISFGEPHTLLTSGAVLYNYASSTHQLYNPDVVILATDVTSSPKKAVSVLASDASAAPIQLITLSGTHK